MVYFLVGFFPVTADGKLVPVRTVLLSNLCVPRCRDGCVKRRSRIISSPRCPQHWDPLPAGTHSRENRAERCSGGSDVHPIPRQRNTLISRRTLNCSESQPVFTGEMPNPVYPTCVISGLSIHRRSCSWFFFAFSFLLFQI